MKKIITVVLLLMSLLATSCGSTVNSEEDEYVDINFDWESAAPLAFEDLLREASETHKKENTESANFDGFEKYLVEGKEYRGLLTSEELSQLKTMSSESKFTLTHEEAVADVELYFRTLKYAYGAYFYFGGDERFEQAQNEVLDKLNDATSIDADELEDYLKSSVSFVRDGHFGFGTSSIEASDIRYEYYYCDLYFSKDETGYYTEKDGQKWYFETCKNEGVSIEPTLTSDGFIKYSPVLFRISYGMEPSDVAILVSGEKHIEFPFEWTLSQSLKENSTSQDFCFKEQDGVAYIAIRNFDRSLDQNVYREYEETAKKVKDCKVIIYDIRSNGGGSDGYSRKWVENFTGTQPILNRCYGNRVTLLTNDTGRNISSGEEYFKSSIENGTYVSNDIPVIILVDDKCGSAGESALNYAKTIENAIVIGSNSSGYQLCGNVRQYSLPNSGIVFNMPAVLEFTYSMNNVDGIGYKPDIWCNPKTALDAVSKLLKRPNLTDAETLEDLLKLPPLIQIQFDQFVIGENEGFGGENFDDDLIIMNNGAAISDYVITFDNPDVAEVTYNEDGSVHIKLPISGEWPFTVTHDGKEYNFLLVV